MNTQPFRCPVCNGGGYVDRALYEPTPAGTLPMTTAIPHLVGCRSCGGTGIVWRAS